MFILGTSSVMTYTGFDDLDLIGPVPQALSAGARAFGAGTLVASIAILMLVGRSIALVSIYFTGNTRLPMVAGWDNLLPGWFSRLHRRYKTPINSILFVGIVTLLFAIVSQLGVGAQEAFQLIDNAAGIFYGIAYLALFAIPICGLRALPVRAPFWLRIVATIGFSLPCFTSCSASCRSCTSRVASNSRRKSSSPQWARTCSAPSSSLPPNVAGERLPHPDSNENPRPQFTRRGGPLTSDLPRHHFQTR